MAQTRKLVVSGEQAILLAQMSRGMSNTQSMVQRIGTLLAKAALSSIPFAALIFDLAQSTVDIANARVIDRYLEELGRRVDGLDEEAKRRLSDDSLHQIAGQGCLRSLLNESNERIAELWLAASLNWPSLMLLFIKGPNAPEF